MMPTRIQRRGWRGWRLPPNAVYVGPGTRWANPFKVSDGTCPHPDCGPGDHRALTSAQVMAAFRRWLSGMIAKDPAYLTSLSGRSLACWCPLGQPCHADALLERANQPLEESEQLEVTP